MYIRILSLLLSLLLLSKQQLFAQDTEIRKWDKEMAVFAQQDSLQTPARKPIVFSGSSSITRWENLQSYFPRKPVLNRGFGGSKTDEVIYHADQAILAYHPKQVVLYVGDNDIASGRTPERVFTDLKVLFTKIRQNEPHATITFISIKPSPSRIKHMPQIEKTNELVKQYLSNLKKTSYVDVYYPMLNSHGRPEASYFGPDSLHMSPTGYALWQKLLKKHLK